MSTAESRRGTTGFTFALSSAYARRPGQEGATFTGKLGRAATEQNRIKQDCWRWAHCPRDAGLVLGWCPWDSMLQHGNGGDRVPEGSAGRGEVRAGEEDKSQSQRNEREVGASDTEEPHGVRGVGVVNPQVRSQEDMEKCGAWLLG